MSKKILIDAARSDEVRLVLTEDSIIKEFKKRKCIPSKSNQSRAFIAGSFHRLW